MVMTYVVTCMLLLLAPLAWRKGWHWTGFLVVVLGALYALTSQPGIQELLKAPASAWLAPQHGRWDARLGELERAVKELNQQVQEQRSAVHEQAGHFAGKQAALTAEQEARQALEGAVEEVKRTVADHQRHLAELDTMAADLFGGPKTESFAVGDEARLIVVGRGEKAVAYLSLAESPRRETVTVRWFSTAFPKAQYVCYKNILVVRTERSAAQLSKHPLSVSYVPDSTRAGERATMALQDGAVTADGQRVEDLITF